jgi:hypothetical protein
VDATTHTHQSELFAVAKSEIAYPHIALIVRWDWYAGENKYFLTHSVSAEPEGLRLSHASNGFTWKQGDAVGDAGLAVRWIREARTHLLRGT